MSKVTSAYGEVAQRRKEFFSAIKEGNEAMKEAGPKVLDYRILNEEKQYIDRKKEFKQYKKPSNNVYKTSEKTDKNVRNKIRKYGKKLDEIDHKPIDLITNDTKDASFFGNVKDYFSNMWKDYRTNKNLKAGEKIQELQDSHIEIIKNWGNLLKASEPMEKKESWLDKKLFEFEAERIKNVNEAKDLTVKEMDIYLQNTADNGEHLSFDELYQGFDRLLDDLSKINFGNYSKSLDKIKKLNKYHSNLLKESTKKVNQGNRLLKKVNTINGGKFKKMKSRSNTIQKHSDELIEKYKAFNSSDEFKNIKNKVYDEARKFSTLNWALVKGSNIVGKVGKVGKNTKNKFSNGIKNHIYNPLKNRNGRRV